MQRQRPLPRGSLFGPSLCFLTGGGRGTLRSVIAGGVNLNEDVVVAWPLTLGKVSFTFAHALTDSLRHLMPCVVLVHARTCMCACCVCMCVCCVCVAWRGMHGAVQIIDHTDSNDAYDVVPGSDLVITRTADKQNQVRQSGAERHGAAQPFSEVEEPADVLSFCSRAFPLCSFGP